MSLVALVAIPAGVAVAAAASGGPPSTQVPAPNAVAPNGGALAKASSSSTISSILFTPQTPIGKAPQETVAQMMARGVSKANAEFIFNSGGGPIVLSHAIVPNGVQPSPFAVIDQALQQKLDEVERYAKAAYDNMAKDGKKAGAKAASELLKLDPPLSGDESYEDMAKIIGGAAGAAALGWLPGGAVLGPICGAWLGVKLEELVSKNVDEVKDWFKSRWNGIENWVSGVGSDIEDGVKDAIDYFGGWF
jgi:hypothetical protein